jgi:hypothetical protein
MTDEGREMEDQKYLANLMRLIRCFIYTQRVG